MGHEELQESLADFVAARLTPDQRRFVEGHLAICPSCEEIVTDLTEIQAQIKEGGDAMFEPHPEPAVLRRFVADPGDDSDPAIRRHLEHCASCRLEADVLARRGAASPADRPGRMLLATASAATAIAVLLGVWIYQSLPGDRVMPPEITPAAPPIGQPVLHILPPMLRGGEALRQEWTLDRSEPYLAVAVPLALPSQAAGTDLYRFELSRTEGPSVWSLDLSAARIREHLAAAEAVNIPAIPAGSLVPGAYEFTVRPAAVPDAPAIYRATIALSYRQSPADTNAPQ